MDNLKSHQAMYGYIIKLMEEHAETTDDALLLEALQHNDIKHACQAIREIRSEEVEFQHLTLRFGADGEQSVYQFDLSQNIQYCLDLFSLYLAIRQTQFQLETFHPDLISNVVVPLQIDALKWSQGQAFFEQVVQCHGKAFAHVIPSLQLNTTQGLNSDTHQLINKIEHSAYSVWFEVSPPCEQLAQICALRPAMLKVSLSLEEKENRQALIPVIKQLRKHKISWVASRVASQKELNQYRLLGASYYFGYFSDIPTALSFKTFESDSEVW